MSLESGYFGRASRVFTIALALLGASCGGGGGGYGGGANGAASYTVGGTVSGLAPSDPVVLQNDGLNAFSALADGAFSFGAAVDGSTYDVNVITQPGTRLCSVSNGVGTVSGADVTNIAVVCSSTTFTVGGTVSGLSGTLVLQDNGGDNLSISTNTSYTFATHVAQGGAYHVTVLTQPAGQRCSIRNGSGTIGGSNVVDVDVSCAANAFTVGGTVSGLSGSVILQDNGADDLAVSVNGPFTFATALAGSSAYGITVLTQPSNQDCTVSNGSGNIAGTDIVNVAVNCVTGPVDLVPGILNLSQPLGPGDHVAASVGVTNAGTGASTATTATIKLFPTADCTGSFFQLSKVNVPAIPAGGGTTSSTSSTAVSADTAH